MIKKLFLVLLLVCLPIFSYANTISKCATKLQEGHVNQAIALGKLAVVLHSNNPLSYMCLALAYALRSIITLQKLSFSKLKYWQNRKN